MPGTRLTDKRTLECLLEARSPVLLEAKEGFSWAPTNSIGKLGLDRIFGITDRISYGWTSH